MRAVTPNSGNAPDAALSDCVPAGPLKTLHVIYGLAPGGAEIYLLNLAEALQARALRERPFEVLVSAWRKGGALEERLAAAGAAPQVASADAKKPVSILGPLGAPLRLVQTVRALARRVRAENIDIIHGHLNDGALLAVLTGRLTGRPVAVHVHSNHVIPLSLGTRGLKHAFWRRAAVWTYARAGAVLTISDEVSAAVIGRFGAPPTAVAPGPIGVPAPVQNVGRAALRGALGVSPETPLALFVGRLVSNKNQAALIDMMGALRARRPGARLVLVGDGPDAQALAQRAAAQGFNEAVIFAGRRADIGDCLAAADVFVTASVTEGVSLAILEAFAAHTPVVAVEAPGNTQLVGQGADERRGWLAADDAPDTLADAVAGALEDPARAQVLARAHAHWRDHHSMEAALDALARAYGDLLSGDARTDQA